MVEIGPGFGVVMFHVKQTPIDKTATFLRGPVNQGETICIDNTYWHPPHQLRAPFYGFAIDVNLQLFLCSGKTCLEIRKPTEQQETGVLMSDALL